MEVGYCRCSYTPPSEKRYRDESPRGTHERVRRGERLLPLRRYLDAVEPGGLTAAGAAFDADLVAWAQRHTADDAAGGGGRIELGRGQRQIGVPLIDRLPRHAQP